MKFAVISNKCAFDLSVDYLDNLHATVYGHTLNADRHTA